jgi:putative N6-adenine-specific DNA methylase
MSRLAVYIVTAPGLEAVTAAEMARLDMKVVDLGVGGLTASLTWSQMQIAHIQLSTATRLLVRLGRFEASGFGDLQSGLRDIPLHEWLPKHSALRLNIAASGSRLFNEELIEEKVRAVVRRPEVEGQTYEGGTFTLHVRISRNVATVSLDATGEPMSQRTWRHEDESAPLRAPIAAGLLHWSGARAHKGALIDPSCGDGTVIIEAARMARRLPAGRDRTFAFESWLPIAAADLVKFRAAADADVRPALKKPYLACESSVELLALAKANAERAGVAGDISFELGDGANFLSKHPQAAVVTNTPQNDRLSTAKRAALFGALATVPQLAVITSAASVRGIEREFDDTLATSNGPSAVRFATAGFAS